jgi:hypothetical protein
VDTNENGGTYKAPPANTKPAKMVEKPVKKEKPKVVQDDEDFGASCQ